MHPFLRRTAAALALLTLATSLSACVVATRPARPGYCYWHPGRC